MATPLPTRARERSPHGLLAGMRIRIKLIVLHTCFSLALAGILVLALRPAIAEVVSQAEQHEAGVVLSMLLSERAKAQGADGATSAALGPSVEVRTGTPAQVGIDDAAAERVRIEGRAATIAGDATRAGVLNAGPPTVVGRDVSSGEFIAVTVTLQGARDAVVRLYMLMTIALLAVYALVAAALELFVLPQHVYGPIRTMLEADAAVQEGRAEDELIPESAMPSDELGEIMRSRNRSIVAVRTHERDLASALAKLEEVATDLKRKNHLLEMARRNMADADRLASLGLMSAGIAHELNTPLAVLKGLGEKLEAEKCGAGGSGRGPVTANEAALMARVVGRLERLSESLLDFARVRPPTSSLTAIRPLVDEAWTLVRLDRAVEGRQVEMINEVPIALQAWCDGDRIVQVLVNLLRNGVDALSDPRASNGVANGRAHAGKTLSVSGVQMVRERGTGEQTPEEWCAISITDNGPGIDAQVLPTLFEPFASTRLDSKGTGLGLAVAEGIVREHGGAIIARNRTEPPGATGAVFEILLPIGGK